VRVEPAKPKKPFVYYSVIGESVQNYANASLKLREYIVYEQTQTYPEYKARKICFFFRECFPSHNEKQIFYKRVLK
jgi:hypothetical protein